MAFEDFQQSKQEAIMEKARERKEDLQIWDEVRKERTALPTIEESAGKTDAALRFLNMETFTDDMFSIFCAWRRTLHLDQQFHNY